LIQLPVLDVAEHRADSLKRFVELVLDLLLQLALATAEPLGYLVQRTTPLPRVLLEVGGGRLRNLLCRAAEIVSKLADHRPLLAHCGLEAVVLLGDLRVRLGGELCESLGDARQLFGEALLKLLELRTPAGETLLDAALDLDQRASEPFVGVPLA